MKNACLVSVREGSSPTDSPVFWCSASVAKQQPAAGHDDSSPHDSFVTPSTPVNANINQFWCNHGTDKFANKEGNQRGARPKVEDALHTALRPRTRLWLLGPQLYPDCQLPNLQASTWPELANLVSACPGDSPMPVAGPASEGPIPTPGGPRL